MADGPSSDVRREIGHVLFIDIVGYSSFPDSKQRELFECLNEVVRGTGQVQAAEAAEKLIRLPTGDGMALAFFSSVDAPVRCAQEISRKAVDLPELRLRMGIHSGTVEEVADVNNRPNVTGAGINLAQRVMDCGDAGHILLSRSVADDLAQRSKWQPYLHELGDVKVKHGLGVQLVNFFGDGFGNPELPGKIVRARKARRLRISVWAAASLFVLLCLTISSWVWTRRSALTTAYKASIAGIPEKSIAVLPFENRSEDKTNAYFADGIQDEILTRLSKIADLKVISRTSTQHYKSAPENLPEIARLLGVAHILEGSVQKSGDSVRVNVQLIKAANDSHLWADTFDRKLTDIFSVESEIAKGIAESLQAKLSGREQQELAAKPTNNLEAYDAYLRGVAFEARYYSSFFLGDLEKNALSFFERAVQLDPNFALAWARLSRANAALSLGSGGTEVWRDAAKRALDNAQKLEPNSPETLLALGYYQYRGLRDYGAAKTTFGGVSKMLPGSSEVPYALGLIARREGQWDQSVAYFEQALALDPRNVELLSNAAWGYGWHRQFPAVLKLYDRVLDITPNDPTIKAAKASVYQAEGNLKEAATFLPEVNLQISSSYAFDTKIIQLRFERNYGEAVRLLQARLTQFHYATQQDKAFEQVTLALMQRLASDTVGAKVTAEQARDTLEPLYKDQPDDWASAAALSQAYAVMGEKALALKLAERAITILPSSKDAVNGPGLEENLALIQAMFGENNRAISTLTQLLQTSYNSSFEPWLITPAILRLDPLWDPLRADLAFQKLCEEKKP